MGYRIVDAKDENFVTEREFLAYIREYIGDYCSDKYWETVYSGLVDKSAFAIKRDLGELVINAVAAEMKTKWE